MVKSADQALKAVEDLLGSDGEESEAAPAPGTSPLEESMSNATRKQPATATRKIAFDDLAILTAMAGGGSKTSVRHFLGLIPSFTPPRDVLDLSSCKPSNR